MTYPLIRLKHKIENLFLFPFIIVGKMPFLFTKTGRNYDTFFFFPFYHTGGAEKVHLQIVEATGNERTIIFFTRKSKDGTFLSSFQNTGCQIKDISKYTDNKLLYFLNFIYRGYIATLINSQHDTPVVFNGQS